VERDDVRKDLRWKLALIVGVIAVCSWMIFPVQDKVHLGLDLKGGIHLVLQVRTDDAVKAALDLRAATLSEQFKRRSLKLERIDHDVQAGGLVVVGADAVSADEFRKVFSDELPSWKVSREGNDYRIAMTPQELSFLRDTAVTDTLERIRKRVDAFGVAEPTVQRQGLSSDRILIQLPGVDNPERVMELMSSPAFLEFKLVSLPPSFQGSSFSGAPDEQSITQMFGGALPPDTAVFQQDAIGTDGTKVTRFWPLTIASSISGNDLVMARRGQNNLGMPAVDFQLSSDAGARFERLTRENLHKQLAIVLDKKVISAPSINGVINTNGIIEGNFSIEEADDLSLKLRSGALPAGTNVLEERTVGPSLGLDSIRKGVTACVAGLGLSVIFMLIYYKGSGVNAVLALVINIFIILGTMSYLGATLSLPGIAGIILTFGIAFDANILVFERIREELRNGKTVRAALDAGFKRAWSAVFDSHVTAVISSVVLIQFGSGPVKGFAVSLCIGLIASMFTVFFVSRALFDWKVGQGRRVERLSI
jgi:preprotein translocase subunit SecD